MKLLARPYLDLIWRTPMLRRGAVICVFLALVISAAEIALAAMREADDFDRIIACCYSRNDVELYLSLCPECINHDRG